jgi:hypothetical protein
MLKPFKLTSSTCVDHDLSYLSFKIGNRLAFQRLTSEIPFLFCTECRDCYGRYQREGIRYFDGCNLCVCSFDGVSLS